MRGGDWTGKAGQSDDNMGCRAGEPGSRMLGRVLTDSGPGSRLEICLEGKGVYWTGSFVQEQPVA
jgi:hypothetical protein